MTTNGTEPYAFFPAGQPAPDFTLTAIKSGREISRKSCAGMVLGLVFHGRETVHAVVEINTTVRPVYPEPKPVVLVSVVDLSIVPRLLHRAVKPMLEQAYDQAAREVPKEYNPADYVFLLPDWNGSVTKAFRVKHTDKNAAIVVVDPAGRVTGSYQGPQPGPAALSLVRQALNGG
jgi:hypothetical protein